MARLLALLCLLAGGHAWAADELAERVIARLASYPVVRAEFVQERTLPSFARPVTSSGRMVLSREQGLLWQVETPVKAAMVFTPSASGNGGAAQAEMARLVRAIISGELRELRSTFSLEAQGELERWTIRLVPKARELAQYLSGVELSGGKHLEAIGIEETSGERLSIRMRNFAVAAELDATERKALLSP